jgi:outer membrane protein
MKRTMPIALLAALLALAAWAGRAVAQDNTLRLGGYFIKYNVKADDISGSFVPPGTNLDVKDTNTLYFAYVRRLNPQWDLQLAAGIPPKTETVGKGPATLGSVPFDGQTLATAKWFSPTLLLNYKFLDESSSWRPYAGVGINYTYFYDIQSTPTGDAVQGGPTKLTLSDSWAPAVTLGMSYRIQGPWTVYASLDYAWIKSKLTSDTAGTIRTTTIHFDPSVLVVSVGYSF